MENNMSEVNLYELGFYNGYASCMLQELENKIIRVRDRKETLSLDDLINEIEDISNCLQMQIDE